MHKMGSSPTKYCTLHSDQRQILLTCLGRLSRYHWTQEWTARVSGPLWQCLGGGGRRPAWDHCPPYVTLPSPPPPPPPPGSGAQQGDTVYTVPGVSTQVKSTHSINHATKNLEDGLQACLIFILTVLLL